MNKMNRRFSLRLLSVTGAMAGLSLATLAVAPAQAASFSLNLKQVTGDPAEVKITVDDEQAGAGKLFVRVDVAEGYIGDIRGIFFNLTDTTLLNGLSITGQDITHSVLGGTKNTGGGNNMNGASSDPFNIAIEIGNAGIGSSGGNAKNAGKGNTKGKSSTGSTTGSTVAADIRSTSFVLSHQSTPLSLSLFDKQSIGVRLMSVGANREGSSKLVGTVTLPALPSPPQEQPPLPMPEGPSLPDPVAEVPNPPVVDLPPSNPETSTPPTPPMENIYLPVHGEFPEDRTEAPVEVPEPGTALALTLGGIAALKGLKRQRTLS